MEKKIDITSLIPEGHDSAITLAELCNLVNCDGRVMRLMISGARKDGAVILNLQDGCGYFRPKNDEIDYVRKAYHQEQSRAMKVLASTKSLHALLDDMEGGRLCATDT